MMMDHLFCLAAGAAQLVALAAMAVGVAGDAGLDDARSRFEALCIEGSRHDARAPDAEGNYALATVDVVEPSAHAVVAGPLVQVSAVRLNSVDDPHGRMGIRLVSPDPELMLRPAGGVEQDWDAPGLPTARVSPQVVRADGRGGAVDLLASGRPGGCSEYTLRARAIGPAGVHRLQVEVYVIGGADAHPRVVQRRDVVVEI